MGNSSQYTPQQLEADLQGYAEKIAHVNSIARHAPLTLPETTTHPLAQRGISASAYPAWANKCHEAFREALHSTPGLDLDYFFVFMIEPQCDDLKQQIRQARNLQDGAELLAGGIADALREAIDLPAGGRAGAAVAPVMPGEKRVPSIVAKSFGSDGTDGKLQKTAKKLITFLEQTQEVDGEIFSNWELLQVFFHHETEKKEGVGRFVRPLRFYNLLPDGGRISIKVAHPDQIDQVVDILADHQRLQQHYREEQDAGLARVFGRIEADAAIEQQLVEQAATMVTASHPNLSAKMQLAVMRFTIGNTSAKAFIDKLVQEGLLTEDEQVILQRFEQELGDQHRRVSIGVARGMDDNLWAVRAVNAADRLGDGDLQQLSHPHNQLYGHERWFSELFTPPGERVSYVRGNVFGQGAEAKASGLVFDQRRIAVHVQNRETGSHDWAAFECQILSPNMFQAKKYGDALYAFRRMLPESNEHVSDLIQTLNQLEQQAYLIAMYLDCNDAAATKMPHRKQQCDAWKEYYSNAFAASGMAFDAENFVITAKGNRTALGENTRKQLESRRGSGVTYPDLLAQALDAAEALLGIRINAAIKNDKMKYISTLEGPLAGLLGAELAGSLCDGLREQAEKLRAAASPPL